MVLLDKHAEDQPGRSSIPAREDGENFVDELLAVVRDDYTVVHMSMKEVSRRAGGGAVAVVNSEVD